MNELLQNAIHIGVKINKEKFGLHREEQGWVIVNRKGQYLSNGLWSSVSRDNHDTAVEAYESLLIVVPIEFSSESA